MSLTVWSQQKDEVKTEIMETWNIVQLALNISIPVVEFRIFLWGDHDFRLRLKFGGIPGEVVFLPAFFPGKVANVSEPSLYAPRSLRFHGKSDSLKEHQQCFPRKEENVPAHASCGKMFTFIEGDKVSTVVIAIGNREKKMAVRLYDASTFFQQ